MSEISRADAVPGAQYQAATGAPLVGTPSPVAVPMAGDTNARTTLPSTMAGYEAALQRAQLDLLDKNQQATHDLERGNVDKAMAHTSDWLDEFDIDAETAQDVFDRLSPADKTAERQKAATDPDLQRYITGQFTPAGQKN